MKWDYLVVRFRSGRCVGVSGDKRNDFNWLLNSFDSTVLEGVGNFGWELVCQRTIDTVCDGYILYFKRPNK